MLHSWEHMMSKGANVRQLCDLTLLLHHYAGQLDLLRLKRWLNQLHLLDVWQLFMSVSVERLGLPHEEAPFYTASCAARAELLLSDMLDGRLDECLTTRKGTVPGNRILRKLYTMRGRMANAMRMKRYSPAYARHMVATTLLHGVMRFFAKDRHWE